MTATTTTARLLMFTPRPDRLPRLFAKRQKLGEDVIAFAFTIKTRALARLGELLKDLGKHEGGRPRKTSSKPEQVFTTLSELGIDRKTSMIAQQLAALPSATREAIAAPRPFSVRLCDTLRRLLEREAVR